MATPAPTQPGGPRIEVPIAPSEERWAQMGPQERERFLEDSLAVLQQLAELAPPEGSPHHRARDGAYSTLSEYFNRVGRKVYLASDLPVHYPGQPLFAPDLFAVLDVEDPGPDDWRMAWVVAEEKHGLDFVMEVLHSGDRQKDLAENVLFYAQLGIPEYFVYDRRRLRLFGFRLPSPSARRYEALPSVGGALASRTLGLDLQITGGRLRFVYGGAVVPETRELLNRVNGLVDELERRAEADAAAVAEAERRLEEERAARAQAEQRAEAEAQRAEAEAQRAEAEAQRADALQQRLTEILAQLEAQKSG